MNLDSQATYLIVLSGFMTVWSYRHVTGSTRTGEFEYLGLSIFWGMLNLALYELLQPDQAAIATYLANPYAAGFALSLIGAALGGLIGFLRMMIKEAKEECDTKKKKK